MKVTKTSPFSGEKHTIEVDVSEEIMDKFRKGKITASQAFDHLSEPERRFLVDGITPEEWEEMFEEADYMRYDCEAIKAFWGCYTVVVLLVGFLCYKYLWS